jgi:RHS repeat-associated protein
MPIAAVINGALYAVHSDHLNTPRRLTNASGQAVWQWAYSAFGDEKPTIAKYRFADLDVNPNPGTTNIPAVTFNQRKPGQYADLESGLVYNGARYFCPVCGRFTQVDPAGLDGGWSPYEYVLNDPLSLIDDDGFAPKKPTSTQPLTPITPFAGSGGGRMLDNGRITPIPMGVPGRALGGGSAAGAGRGVINPPCPPAAGAREQFVDLAPAARRHHILDGEVRPDGSFGGGHRAGTGFPGKSEFPQGWSDDKIMNHISDVATDPLSTTRAGRGGDVFVRGTRGGIEIEALIRRGQIWTGYPVNVPRNP